MRRLVVSLILIGSIVLFAAPVIPAGASGSPTLSAGCAAINAMTPAFEADSGPLPFNAGEVITYRMAGQAEQLIGLLGTQISEKSLGIVSSRTIYPYTNKAAVQTSYIIQWTAVYDFHFLSSAEFGGSLALWNYGNSLACRSTALPGGSRIGSSTPAGFILRPIRCTTPIYDAPNGRPVPGAQVKTGQTWYVNPADLSYTGSGWTEIFVSGRINGYIPIWCVGLATNTETE